MKYCFDQTSLSEKIFLLGANDVSSITTLVLCPLTHCVQFCSTVQHLHDVQKFPLGCYLDQWCHWFKCVKLQFLSFSSTYQNTKSYSPVLLIMRYRMSAPRGVGWSTVYWSHSTSFVQSMTQFYSHNIDLIKKNINRWSPFPLEFRINKHKYKQAQRHRNLKNRL